jgi:hypothetical protein
LPFYLILNYYTYSYGFAFLGDVDLVGLPLAILDAETLELTPDFVPLVPAVFIAETLEFKPT